MEWALQILATLFAILIGIITYLVWAFSYWKRKGVPYLPPNFQFRRNPSVQHDLIGRTGDYRKLKGQGHKHAGLYLKSIPIYLPIDLAYVKNITSKDFSHFMDHGRYYNERDDPMSAHLFNIEGDKWKNLRAKLSPAFSPGKIKKTFPTIIACCAQLTLAMEEMEMRNEAVQIKDVFRSFTIDIIGSCAFGLDCNSFKEPNGEFQKWGGRYFRPTKTVKIKHMIAQANAKLARALTISVLDQDVSKFFLNVVKDTVEYREKTNLSRRDFLQVLIDLKNENQDGENITVEQIAAQALLFFLAGFESSSSTMSFCLYEIAKDLEIQRKVKKEVAAVLGKYDDEICYKAIVEMKYLEQVLEETLRFYPPSAVLTRICVKDYHVPKTNVVIEEGTKVIVPVHALHHDPEFFPEPERFDPDRFDEGNRKNIRPFSYMPFGEGPRICIGTRLAMVEMKIGLAILLKRFEFSVNPKTRQPLVLVDKRVMIEAKDGIWLNIGKN